MIIKDNLEFHAAELLPQPSGGFALIRIPKKLSETLGARVRFVALDSVDTEIRFYTKAPRIHLYLSAQEMEIAAADLDISVFFGNFECKVVKLPCGGGIQKVVIERPPELDRVLPEKLRSGNAGFDPNVVRIISNRCSFIYHGIDTLGYEVRPPKPSERPALKCLCYGSSITNSRIYGYPFTMTHTLGMDLCNIGLSGSCFAEPQLIDWMSRLDWDIATLELGINLLWIEVDDFAGRAEYAISKFIETGKPVFVFTIFPSVFDPVYGQKQYVHEHVDAFNEILRTLCCKFACDNLFLLEGDQIEDSINCLGCDFVHPKAYGYFRMGMNLANLIREKLPEKFK